MTEILNKNDTSKIKEYEDFVETIRTEILCSLFGGQVLSMIGVMRPLL